MYFSKPFKYSLIIFLILLNFLIRIPSVSHEVGNDSFDQHILANSISTFGYAKWWVHPASIFGFYPYSYASAVPFILSGMSQLTGISMEWIAWLFSVLIGVFSIFTAYLLAKATNDDDIFKFLVAFSYSLTPGILAYTTWEVAARGLFIVLLPLFVYLLLKTRTSIMKCSMLAFTLFILLMATHHLFFYVFPIILTLVILIILYKTGRIFKSFFKFNMPNNFINITYIICLFAMFLVPFFTRTFIKGSRYALLNMILQINVRYVGVMIVFAIGGFVYLSLKHNKRFEEWFILLILISLAPLLYIEQYTHFFILIFASILAGIALTNVAKMNKQKKNVFSFIGIILLLSVIFSGFYQHWRTSVGAEKLHTWYMTETSYNGALWIKDNIEKNKRLVGYDDLIARRIFAISEAPTFTGTGGVLMLTYGFTSISDINITRNSPLTISFYMDNPYVKEPFPSEIGWFYFDLRNWGIDSQQGDYYIYRFNLSYVIENDNYKNFFIESLSEKKDNIFDNGVIRLWNLNQKI